MKKDQVLLENVIANYSTLLVVFKMLPDRSFLSPACAYSESVCMYVPVGKIRDLFAFFHLSRIALFVRHDLVVLVCSVA